jgi:hypothetical protein
VSRIENRSRQPSDKPSGERKATKTRACGRLRSPTSADRLRNCLKVKYEKIRKECFVLRDGTYVQSLTL